VVTVIIRSIAEIMEEMKNFQMSRHPRLTNYEANSVLTYINESVSDQIRKIEVALQQGLDALSLYTATGSDLDYLVKDRLVEGRLQGTRATGEITFGRKTPAPYDIVIPQRTLCIAPSVFGSVAFETTEEATLPTNETQVVVNAKAIDVGERGNVSPNMITIMPQPIPGIDYVYNQLAFAGGEDQETDEELRNRYIYAGSLSGKATKSLVEQHIKDYPGARQTIVTTLNAGEIMIIVDCSNTQESINSVSNLILENIAAGILSIGCLAAQIVAGVENPSLNTSEGGKIFIRTKDYVASLDNITGTYKDQNDASQAFSITIPAGTPGGVGLPATMVDNTYAKEITSLTYTGSKSYDILIGLGNYPYLFNRPKPVPINIYVKIKKEATFEENLEWNIEQSLTAWASSFEIGDDVEYADMIKWVFRDYRNQTKNFEGIDDIVTAYIVGKGTTISSFGSKLIIAEDERITLSAITVEST